MFLGAYGDASEATRGDNVKELWGRRFERNIGKMLRKYGGNLMKCDGNRGGDMMEILEKCDGIVGEVGKIMKFRGAVEVTRGCNVKRKCGLDV
jgi:hypothetical protein